MLGGRKKNKTTKPDKKTNIPPPKQTANPFENMQSNTNEQLHTRKDEPHILKI